MKRFIVSITGASGVIYGVSLLKELLHRPYEITVIISKTGREVMAHEMKFQGNFAYYLKEQLEEFRHPKSRLIQCEPDSLFASAASGSYKHDGMVIVPCTMKTLAAVASGHSGNLITRAADVCLKERRPLILVPRETPYNIIHMENMLKAANAGALILPPTPAFYFHPQSVDEIVDFVVGRILDHLGVEHSLVKEWGNEDEF